MKMVRNQRKNMSLIKLEDRQMSGHTVISYIMSIIAVIGMLVLGLRHFQDVDEFGSSWGRFALLHFGLGIIGYFVTRMINSRMEFRRFLPFQNMRPIDPVAVAWQSGVVFGIAILSQLIATAAFLLEITSTEQALYWVFSAVTEELFFRGFMCYGVLWMVFRSEIFYNRQPKVIIGKVIVALISGVAFGLAHVNYYGTNMIYAVMLSGALFGLFFVFFTKFNLTSMILGHFILNFFVSINYLMSFS